MKRQAMEILRGGTVIPALPLVLDENRRFDEAGQRRLVRYYLSAGVGGLAVAVHTTQFEIRDPGVDLFERVITVARDEIGRFEAATGKTVLAVCGVCGPQAQAVREGRLAKQAGYDALLLSPGGLGALEEDALVQRTRAVAGVLPVISFYLQAAVGGRRFGFDYWQKTCEIPNMVAVKAAPFDRYATLDVARAVAQSGRAEEITLYTGNDDNIVLDLLTVFRFDELGEEAGFGGVRFCGGLLGHWAVWTHTAVKLYEELRALRGQRDIPARMLTLAAQVTDCNSAFFDVANGFAGCITGIHEVLRRQGLMRGIWTLNPAEGLSSGQAREIDRVYAAYPSLNDDAFVEEFLAAEAVG